MWQKISEWLVGITALISAPFVSAPPAQTIDEPIVVQEVPALTETAQEPVAAEPQKEDLVQSVEPASTPTPDPYCAKYASKYTASEYQKEKKKADKVEEDCEEDNEERKEKAEDKEKQCEENGSKCSVKAFQMNCKNVREKHDKAFSDWEEQYDSYQSRCK